MQKYYAAFVVMFLGVAASNSGPTSLFLACQNGKLEVASSLIKSGSNVNARAPHGESPLFVASQNGYLEIVLLLVEAGSSIDMFDENENSPLLVASENDHVKIVRELCARGAQVNKVNKKGVSPLWIASQKGYSSITQILLENKNIVVDMVAKGFLNRNSLHQASQGGYIDVVRQLINANIPLDEVDDEGATALLIALSEKKVKIADMLVKSGARVNQADNKGLTPLLLAVDRGYEDIVELLLPKKVIVNNPAKGYLNRTPLHQASEKGYLGIVLKLIEAGADINVLDDKGATPLSLALEFGHKEVEKILKVAEAKKLIKNYS